LIAVAAITLPAKAGLAQSVEELHSWPILKFRLYPNPLNH
jgi:hypothetical protein